ncbi:DNA (cytosine-5-)-methyltransferase [Clostridium sp. 7_2_43FAA]|uniref:DNA cytosine methyltransferase n=1 Tax=Clostridium TaxID=1485 RepID=UPI000287A60B|nr:MULTISPECIES: DNA (cytosine-5-)-methyltransferase [Clostridium]EEH97401.2 DNA (cytosine-5-)-methyltransferase [Clostridium sp. 7_2_43FAA]
MYCIDLFAGAGGLSEGFQRKGFKFFAHVEMDKAACMTLQTRQAFYFLKRNRRLYIYESYLRGEISREELYSNVPNRIFKSIINAEINEDTIEDVFEKIDENRRNREVDVIIGGPPCQAYSVIGRSRDPNGMIGDRRNYLYLEYIKFLNRYRPKVFVFENVLGLLSAQNGTIFEDMKINFSEAGYKIDYKVLNAKDFGVLEDRRRIIIIGWREDIDFRYPTFNIKRKNFTIRDLFSDLPFINSGEYNNEYLVDTNECLIKTHVRKNWNVLSQHECRLNNERDLSIYRMYVETWNSEGRKLRYNELPEELMTHSNRDSFLDRFNIVPYEGICHTVVAHMAKDGHYYIHPDINQNRSLSVREAARIQSFPDDYYFENSRTAAFKQIGNAVPPLMAEMIALSIKKQLEHIE